LTRSLRRGRAALDCRRLSQGAQVPLEGYRHAAAGRSDPAEGAPFHDDNSYWNLKKERPFATKVVGGAPVEVAIIKD
jgi:hypothetical protein